jgi:hypothetical protein
VRSWGIREQCLDRFSKGFISGTNLPEISGTLALFLSSAEK